MNCILLTPALMAAAPAAIATSTPAPIDQATPAPPRPDVARQPGTAVPSTTNSPTIEGPIEQSAPTIVVTGRRAEIESKVDRLSYRIGSDIQAATGSVADILQNVPSVQVDGDGSVSLRGDPNVVILVDGQPSATLRGPNQGTGLQQLPAGRFDRVEVMTTPSAAYGPEGSGGVINLISKRARGAEHAGSANVTAGGRGRGGGGFTLTQGGKRTNLSVDGSVRRYVLFGETERTRSQTDAITGRSIKSRQLIDPAVIRPVDGTLRVAVEHSFSKDLRLSVEGNVSVSRNPSELRERFVSAPSLMGQPDRYAREAFGRTSAETGELRARLTRTFGASDHSLILNGSYQDSRSDRMLRARTMVTSPYQDDASETFGFGSDQRQMSFKADYARPLSGGAKLQLGYEFERLDNGFRNDGSRGITGQPLAPLPSFTNRFEQKQTLNAIYATFEKSFGAFTILPGARIERVDLDLNQVTTGARFTPGYLRVYPSLSLSRKLTDTDTLRGSFSRRVQRPDGQDLNPFQQYRDPLSVRAGNALLKPQITDSLEASWQHRPGRAFYQATLFYRYVHDAFTDVVRDLGDDVLLTTRANLGRSSNLGVELIVNRPLGQKLILNASVSAAYNRIDAGDLGLPERSATQLNGRATLNWKPTPNDQIQFSGFVTGRVLRPQGYREPSGMVTLGYRRRVSEQLSLVATVRDVLDSFGETVVYRTPTFDDRVKRKYGGRFVMLALNYVFGGGQKAAKEPAFDFSTGKTE